MKLKTAQQKLSIIIKVFVISFLIFVSIYLPFVQTLHPYIRLIYLTAIIPITMSVGSGFLCKIRVGPIFLIYVITFSALHYFMFHGHLAYSELIWIACWIVVPSFSSWGIVMCTWTGHPNQVKSALRESKREINDYNTTEQLLIFENYAYNNVEEVTLVEETYDIDYMDFTEELYKNNNA
ncbi:MAG: hypothetical protein LBV67_05120 [Streptococcaceae bacterium]|jgi:hypothetical protein|nr:hypothetical protein [Streptococcaceae bacterium]